MLENAADRKTIGKPWIARHRPPLESLLNPVVVLCRCLTQKSAQSRSVLNHVVRHTQGDLAVSMHDVRSGVRHDRRKPASGSGGNPSSTRMQLPRSDLNAGQWMKRGR